MVSIYYAILLVISILIAIFVAQHTYENVDIHHWTITVIVPLVILGYWLKTRVTTTNGAMIAFSYIYLDSTLMLAVILCALLYFMRVRVKPWLRLVIYGTSFAHMFVFWLCINNRLYYKSVKLVDTGVGIATKMESGPLKVIHWIYIAVILFAIVTVILVAWIRRGTYSRRTLIIYTVLLSAGLLLYIIESFMDVDFSMLPTLYVIADAIIALNYDRDHTHDISSLVSRQQEQHSGRAYVAIDLSGRFLSCNKKAYDFLPELEMQIVDAKLPERGEAAEVLYGLKQDFLANKTLLRQFQMGDMVCQCEISEFSLRVDGEVQGYIFDIRDITEEQHVIKVMRDYNDALNEEVNRQMKAMVNMQERMVLGLADMMDSRDKEQSGRARRTNALVHILVGEIQRQDYFKASLQFFNDMLRATPMYDLGRICIDQAIISKGSDRTTEEQALYESHAVKSGEFVHRILDEAENPQYVKVAYHIARNHHERWDGRGYPDGLVGEMIPLEARIVALADTFDEWVAEKKKGRPMEETLLEVDNMVEEEMGSRFDPNLQEVFMASRKKIEEYYISQEMD